MMNNGIVRDECFDSIRWLEDLDQGALLEAGGKGANLGELVKAALGVPPGFLATAAAYRAHLEAAGLPDRIAQRLQDLSALDLDGVTAASRDITAWIVEAPIQEAIEQAVLRSYAALAERVAAPEAPAP